ncbi:MAG: amidohydrolase family protein, partial [Proteobacteria bacterium]|nr:amidohydrolase family protein [Pseudomonadota bacterium]
AVCDHLQEPAGKDVVDRFNVVIGSAELTRGMDPAKKRELGIMRMPWWGLPTRNTLDRATAMLPQLMYDRLDEIGLDFAVLYPTYGLFTMSLDDDEVRQAASRAFNEYQAETFRPYGDRLTPVAIIPMHTPEEAIEALDHAVLTCGLKAAMVAGHVMRPFAGVTHRKARWMDTFCLDSAYDYDPVWARFSELGIAPTFHSSGMGWGSRDSVTNYVFNHLGNFATAGEAICRALFLGGVPWRFPELRFAFLEGGVGWAANLYSDIIGHWEKRNPKQIQHYNPANLDREQLVDLFKRYGTSAMTDRIDRLVATGAGSTEGRLAIIDYKTGAPPSASKVENGFAPQLPLEAAIAEAGGFEDVPRGKISRLVYIRARGHGAGGEEREACPKVPAPELAAHALEQLEELVAAYANETQAYDAQRRAGFDYRYDDYAHLARVREWQAGGGAQ